MKKVIFIFGTRPEAVKMCPVIKEFRKHDSLETIVLVSGQHRQMLDQVLKVFGIVPNYDLGIMKEGQDLFDISNAVLNNVRGVLESVNPDLILVHGDTTTSFASALAAYYLRIPIAHVEAGLRTYNIHSPYPEEFNRIAVDSLSDLLFAPTVSARDNLIKEGKEPANVFVTGNTVIDALKSTYRPDFINPDLLWAKDSRIILLTMHRRENLGQAMKEMMGAIRKVMDEHEDCKLIFPMHKNEKVRELAFSAFEGQERIRLIEPLDPISFHNVMARSYLILTDSGGIQEEAPSMNVPVLVLRDTTERPEGIEAGTARIVGTQRDDIYHSVSLLLDNKEEYEKMTGIDNPYGDGKASERIFEIVKTRLG